MKLFCFSWFCIGAHHFSACGSSNLENWFCLTQFVWIITNFTFLRMPLDLQELLWGAIVIKCFVLLIVRCASHRKKFLIAPSNSFVFIAWNIYSTFLLLTKYAYLRSLQTKFYRFLHKKNLRIVQVCALKGPLIKNEYCLKIETCKFQK